MRSWSRTFSIVRMHTVANRLHRDRALRSWSVTAASARSRHGLGVAKHKRGLAARRHKAVVVWLLAVLPHRELRGIACRQ